MSTPTPANIKPLDEIVREVGLYAAEAFEFVRDSLTLASDRVHGPMSSEQKKIAAWMNKHNHSLEDLEKMISRQSLPAGVEALLEQSGGLQAMNRHVTGQELSRALKDIAIERWGYLARTVLEHWGIHGTQDFGRIVFALVDNHILSKQPTDSIRDFERVYDFDEAFDRGHAIRTDKPRKQDSE